jgi:hypothetical protein
MQALACIHAGFCFCFCEQRAGGSGQSHQLDGFAVNRNRVDGVTVRPLRAVSRYTQRHEAEPGQRFALRAAGQTPHGEAARSITRQQFYCPLASGTIELLLPHGEAAREIARRLFYFPSSTTGAPRAPRKPRRAPPETVKAYPSKYFGLTSHIHFAATVAARFSVSFQSRKIAMKPKNAMRGQSTAKDEKRGQPGYPRSGQHFVSQLIVKLAPGALARTDVL